MQIVIEISEHDKEWIQNGYVIPDEIHTSIVESIINGTVLPKHGRLIDADELPLDIDYVDIENAPIILEANKTESEK